MKSIRLNPLMWVIPITCGIGAFLGFFLCVPLVLGQQTASTAAEPRVTSFTGLENGSVLIVDETGARELVPGGTAPRIRVVEGASSGGIAPGFSIEDVPFPPTSEERLRTPQEIQQAVTDLRGDFLEPVDPALPASALDRIERGSQTTVPRESSAAHGPVAIPPHLMYPGGLTDPDLAPVAVELNDEIRQSATPVLPPSARNRMERNGNDVVDRPDSLRAGMPFAYETPLAPPDQPVSDQDRALAEKAKADLLAEVTPRLPDSAFERSRRSPKYENPRAASSK